MIIHLVSWVVPVRVADVGIDQDMRAFLMLRLLWHSILAILIQFLMARAENCVNKLRRVRIGSFHDLNVYQECDRFSVFK